MSSSKKKQAIYVTITVSGADRDVRIEFRPTRQSEPESGHLDRLVLSGGTIDLRQVPEAEGFELHATIVLKLTGEITIGDRKHPVHFADKNGAFLKPNRSYGRDVLLEILLRSATDLELDYPFNGDGLTYEYGLNLVAPGTDWTHKVDPAIINRLGGGGGP
jgi:hypothetical protein